MAAEKEILLTSGGAYIKIRDGNIYLHGPGIIEHKAASFPFKGPTSLSYAMPHLPKLEGNYNLRFHFVDDDGVPYANKEYTLFFPDGSSTTGVTDENGYTLTEYFDFPEKIRAHLKLDQLG
ncbi:hypothetical protein CUZ56_03033 [Saezia sanguinis]|uniref:DUF2345 domain-containing protein n=1 Tax=Saezia sanguinis TaxID=1965230 RepID=A0A433S9N9_9BURK|nr:hypothetical protein CUZ56_03033 [Saezia sanguinis]